MVWGSGSNTVTGPGLGSAKTKYQLGQTGRQIDMLLMIDESPSSIELQCGLVGSEDLHEQGVVEIAAQFDQGPSMTLTLVVGVGEKPSDGVAEKRHEGSQTPVELHHPGFGAGEQLAADFRLHCPPNIFGDERLAGNRRGEPKLHQGVLVAGLVAADHPGMVWAHNGELSIEPS